MSIRDVGAFILLAGLWGGSFLFMRIAAPVLGPIWLIELRVLIAALALLPVVIHTHLWPKVRHHWAALLFVGCINSAIPFTLFAFATVSLPAGFTAILNATAPLFGTLFAFIWLKERLSPTQILGFGLGFVGVMVLIGWQMIAITPTFVTAVAAGLVAAIAYALAAPYIKSQLAGVPPLVITVGSQLGAAVVLAPLLPFSLPSQPITEGVIVAVLSLALLSTAFAYTLYFQLIHRVGVTKTLTVTYLIPLFAMLWGALFLNEAVTVTMMAGCTLILLGTAFANDLFAECRVKLSMSRRLFVTIQSGAVLI